MGKEIVVKCQECGNKLKTDEKFVGRKGKCPKCGASIRIAAPDQSGAEKGQQVVTVSEVAGREGALLRIMKQDEVAVVEFTTSRILDQTNVQQLGEEFDELLEKHDLEKIVLNFDKINFMSSAVMGKLVSLHKKVSNRGGKLKLCNISSDIFEIFKIMRFDRIFDIEKTVDNAVADLMG